MAGVIQLLFQLPFLMRIKLMPIPIVDWQDPGVRRILSLMVPALFGVSVAQINLLLDTVLATFLQTGSVSWLYYSDRLAELPLGVFAIAISTVIMPSLSRKSANKSMQSFAVTLDWALRMIFLIGLPSALALFLLAEPLLVTLFGYGNMNEQDIVMAAKSLRAYSLWAAGVYVNQSASAWFFCQARYENPCKNSNPSDGCQHDLQFNINFPLCARRVGSGNFHVGIFECRLAVVRVIKSWSV